MRPFAVICALSGFVLGMLAVTTLCAQWIGLSDTTLPQAQHGVFTLGFVVVFVPLLAVIVRAFGPLHLGPRTLAAGGCTFLCAVSLEIGLDTLWVRVFGEPLWLYRVWPVHGGYTSGLGLVLWPMYGAFVHSLHHALKARWPLLHGVAPRAALIAVEAMVLEVAANLYGLLSFGCFIFYYTPGDLHHYTSFAVLPPYLAAGFLGVWVLDRLEHVNYPAVWGLVSWAVAAAIALA